MIQWVLVFDICAEFVLNLWLIELLTEMLSSAVLAPTEFRQLQKSPPNSTNFQTINQM